MVKFNDGVFNLKCKIFIFFSIKYVYFLIFVFYYYFRMATWDDYLHSQQNNDGIQMTWNVWPHSRVDAQKLVVPVTTFFTPLKVVLFYCFFY